MIADKNEQSHRIDLIGGGSIDFWSLENGESLRGRKYAHVVVDEAAKVRSLESLWFSVIRPTLVDLRGSADFLSTPRGRNFFAKLHAFGQDPERSEWNAFHATSYDNPHIPRAEIDELRKTLPDRVFRQEVLAEFVEDAGGVFRGVTEVVERGRHRSEQPESSKLYTMGVDLARVNDFTVLTVLDQTGRMVYFERFNQISWERQIESIARVATRYDARVIVDSTGVGDPIFERLRRAGLKVIGYHLTSQSKSSLIDNLAMAIEGRKISIFDLPVLVNELVAYEYEITASRNIRTNAPEGQHDDCVISLALACYGAVARKRIEVLGAED